MGLTVLLRDRVDYLTAPRVSDGRGGRTTPAYATDTANLPARVQVREAAPDRLAQQLGNRAFANILVDPRRTTTGSVVPGSRFLTRDGRLWEVVAARPKGASVGATAQLWTTDCAEVL